MAVKGSNGAGALDPRHLREEATSITDAAARIMRITDQVSEGADMQIRSLDDAVSGLNQMTASLKETAVAG
jgi:methyl-accepting chemotaxis protein